MSVLRLGRLVHLKSWLFLSNSVTVWGACLCSLNVLLYCYLVWIFSCQVMWVWIDRSACVAVFTLWSLPLPVQSLLWHGYACSTLSPTSEQEVHKTFFFFLIFMFTAICNVCLDIRRVFLLRVRLFFFYILCSPDHFFTLK